MREARIILPHRDNAGEDVSGAHHDLKLGLLALAGGYTCQNVFGGWRHPSGAVIEDESTAYDVAVHDIPEAIAGLRRLALVAGRAARQDCVYFRRPDGEVELIPVEPPAIAKAA